MSNKIFHNTYKRDWIRAFPLGNGRIGAMLYGDPHKETLEINEESLWSGKQLKETFSTDAQNLDNIRELLFQEKYEKAAQLCSNTLLATPRKVRPFESFGELYLDFADKSDYSDYKKELNLQEAIASVFYQKGGITYHSETFISEKYDCLVYKITADGGRFSCRVSMERGQDASTAALNKSTVLLNGQIMCRESEKNGDGFAGMRFGAQLYVVSDGETSCEKSAIYIKDATEICIFAAFATTYDIKKFDYDNTIDYQKRLSDTINAVSKVDYNEIKAAHIRSHRQRFDKVFFELDENVLEDVPTDERLRRVAEEGAEDLDLYTLYYNFGRYLLIACSGMNATLPANLQGIWSTGFTPPWECDYHTNINLQMNYWCAENTNLSETFLPFANYVKKLSEFGAATAQQLFNSSGWICNHTSDIFGRTGIHDSVQWGFFPMAGPWLCLNLFEHYEFTGDRAYLEEIYPVLKGACDFVLDFLVEKDGVLVTAPSNSPENLFYYMDGDKKCQSIFTYGATMDFEIIYALFTRTIFACELLERHSEFAASLKKTLEKLPPLRISERYGTICEWIKDYEEVDPGHRHVSHLFGLYPGDQINESDPLLYDAAKKTVERRLAHKGGETGWSKAWAINFFARLKNGSAAGEMLKELVQHYTAESMFNIDILFNIYPPFQIEGNLGAIAGITEMLLQSHGGALGQRIIELLPALPPQWKRGCIKGLKARGGFVFDIEWNNAALTKVRVTSENQETLRLKMDTAHIQTAKQYTVTDYGLSMELQRGETVEICFN